MENNTIKIQNSSLYGNINIPKDETCHNENFNKQMVKEGKAKTIEEAGMMPRWISCPCSKCNTIVF